MTGMLLPPSSSEENISIPSGFWRITGWFRSPWHGLFQPPLKTLRQWKYGTQTASVKSLRAKQLKVRINTKYRRWWVAVNSHLPSVSLPERSLIFCLTKKEGYLRNVTEIPFPDFSALIKQNFPRTFRKKFVSFNRLMSLQMGRWEHWLKLKKNQRERKTLYGLRS